MVFRIYKNPEKAHGLTIVRAAYVVPRGEAYGSHGQFGPIWTTPEAKSGPKMVGCGILSPSLGEQNY